MAYCTTEDLLVGGIRESTGLSYQKYVDDAADEIDSQIGFVYETPIPTTTPPTPRPVVLLLKRINAHLASGRLILAATVAAEDAQLNAYGASLVESAQLAIASIAEGKTILDGVTAGTSTVPTKAAPRISNGDPYSYVDQFYDVVVNPSVSPPFVGGYGGYHGSGF